MIRVFVTIVLPLLLPTALYLLWVTNFGARRDSGRVAWTTVPWIWLAGVGAILLIVVLFVITIGFGTSQEGVYVAPHVVNGRIVPGHIVPEPAR